MLGYGGIYCFEKAIVNFCNAKQQQLSILTVVSNKSLHELNSTIANN